jgi:hypothetical protein
MLSTVFSVDGQFGRKSGRGGRVHRASQSRRPLPAPESASPPSYRERGRGVDAGAACGESCEESLSAAGAGPRRRQKIYLSREWQRWRAPASRRGRRAADASGAPRQSDSRPAPAPLRLQRDGPYSLELSPRFRSYRTLPKDVILRTVTPDYRPQLAWQAEGSIVGARDQPRDNRDTQSGLRFGELAPRIGDRSFGLPGAGAAAPQARPASG